MALLQKLRDKIEAQRKERAYATDGLLVIAITMNNSLKVVQLTSWLGNEEIDKIEGILAQRKRGTADAVDYFFPVGGSKMGHPQAYAFLRFLEFAVSSCLAVLRDPRSDLEGALDSFRIRDEDFRGPSVGSRRNGLLADAEQMLHLAGQKRLPEFGAATEVLQEQVSMVLIPLLHCVAALTKAERSPLVDMLAHTFKMVRAQKEQVGARTSQCIGELEPDPVVGRWVERHEAGSGAASI